MSKITINNFKISDVIKTEYGHFLPPDYYRPVGKWEINYSGILTYLIQQTGRLCDYYASDLFVDWFNLITEIKADKNGTFESRKILFGLREMGVDGNSYVCSNMENYEYAEFRYRALYMLEISVNGRDMELKLGKAKFERYI